MKLTVLKESKYLYKLLSKGIQHSIVSTSTVVAVSSSNWVSANIILMMKKLDFQLIYNCLLQTIIYYLFVITNWAGEAGELLY